MSRSLKWSGFSVGTQFAYWHWHFGRQQLCISQDADAAGIYRSALQDRPNDADLHFRLGFVLHQAGDRDSAHQCYERALSLRPSACLYLEHLGRLYFEDRAFSKAVPVLRHSIQCGQVQPLTLALLGRSYYEMRDYSSALDSYRHLLTIDLIPEIESVIRHQLVLTLTASGNLGAARRACLSLIDTHLLDYDLLMQLCDTFLSQNCISPAKEILCHLIKRREEFLPARQKYVQVLARENLMESLIPGIYASDEEEVLRYVCQLMRYGHEKAARALQSLRTSDSPLIRQNVVEYCCRFGYMSWGDIEEFLKDESPLVRSKAAEYLARFAPGTASQAMQVALKDQSPLVRGFAARFFKLHGLQEVLPDLTKAAMEETDPGTRIKIRAAITTIQRRQVPGKSVETMKRMTHPEPPVLDRVSLWALCSLLASVLLLSSWIIFK